MADLTVIDSQGNEQHMKEAGTGISGDPFIPYFTLGDGGHATFGAQADAAAAGDTSTASYVSLFKRLLQRVTTLLGQLPAALTGSGNLKAAIVESTATVSVKLTANQGAANLATSQVTATTTAGTLAAARATRRSCTIKNTDGAVAVYVGPATVTSANGLPLLAGESVALTWTGLIQVIAASGTPVLAVADEYD